MSGTATRSLAERVMRQRSFRNDVVRFMRSEHGLAVHQPPDDLKLSAALAARPSDILGLPDWVIRCHAGSEVRLSTWLHSASADADWDHAPLFAVVHHARGHELADDIVSMPLSVFAAVLAQRPAPNDPAEPEA